MIPPYRNLTLQKIHFALYMEMVLSFQALKNRQLLNQKFYLVVHICNYNNSREGSHQEENLPSNSLYISTHDRLSCYPPTVIIKSYYHHCL